MRISKSTDPHDGSSCELLYDEANQWLSAIWTGYADSLEAQSGAVRFLDAMHTFHCPFLLNDNSRLSGPWFSSVDWLRDVWAPQAAQMGLRYIAHVASPTTRTGCFWRRASLLATPSSFSFSTMCPPPKSGCANNRPNYTCQLPTKASSLLLLERV